MADVETGDDLIACQTCDALLTEPPATLARGARARCPRCGAVLAKGSGHALDGAIAAALCTVMLIAAATALPFVSLIAGSRERTATVIDAAAAAGGDAWPLAVAVGALILGVPLLRALALLYALVPLRLGRDRARGARGAFRLAVELRPWSMVEVFVIGVAVALVKIVDLAEVGLGGAFWLFAALALVAFYEDAVLAPRAIWRRLS